MSFAVSSLICYTFYASATGYMAHNNFFLKIFANQTRFDRSTVPVTEMTGYNPTISVCKVPAFRGKSSNHLLLLKNAQMREEGNNHTTMNQLLKDNAVEVFR